MKKFYFSRFEDRRPYSPVKADKTRTRIFQILAVMSLISGVAYLCWRWAYSLNWDSPVFSLALVIAETFSFIGIFLLVFDLWNYKDAERQSPPHFLSDIEDREEKPDRPLSIDVFIATLNEEAELLRYTIRDAKAMKLPYEDISLSIYVLDDGRRDGRDAEKENLKALCEEENVNYLTRENNTGYKAGNLKNGLQHSNGDLFVILDADCRPFPDFLINTLGYFRKKNVAWVQTCHWFYDTTEAVPLSEYIIRHAGITWPSTQKVLSKLFGRFKTGADIYGSDPRQFYEVIQRKRNFHNASFCCGASSVHRREAVMSAALRLFSESLTDTLIRERIPRQENIEQVKKRLFSRIDITPFKYHASEDLYTSMIIHSDREKNWESVLHPYVESKLLSPQDINTFAKQRTRYASGSLDIFFHDNPLFKKGLTWRQKLCYFHSVWSYFSCLWLMVFMSCPIIYFYTHELPVSCSLIEFFTYFLPFYLLFNIADRFGSPGVSQKRGKQYYIGLFWLNFLSLLSVVTGRKIKFNVTSKSRQQTESLKYCWPHLLIIGLTVLGIVFNVTMIREGHLHADLGFLINLIWGLQNCYILFVFVRAAFWDTTLWNDDEGNEKAKPAAKAKAVLRKEEQVLNLN
jgi:cellulose synthase (UDP-forming)